MKAILLICALGLTLASCSDGGSDKKGGGNGPQANPNGVEWNTVPSEFNPHVEQVDFPIAGLKKISTNLFSFSGDVHLRYSDQLTDSGVLQIFSVSKEARTSVRGVDVNNYGTALDIKRYGNYECSIRISNRRIAEVKGACYVRLVLTLPKGSQVEYYNAGTLISQRFVPMSNEEFLERMDDARSDEYMSVIDGYIASYRAPQKPSLTCYELEKVLDEVTFKDKKMAALRKLHSYISDRENLSKTIEDNFSYFEREEARRIVGLRN